MNTTIRFILLGIAFISFSGFFHLQPVERIMMHMESQSLYKGKRVDMQADIYYRASDGRLVTRYHDPVKHIMITNNKGELVIYNHEDHTVYREQRMDYSTDNHLVYFFLSGQVHDLGLRQMGFERAETLFIDELVKTVWLPAHNVRQMFGKIELVHEDYLPVYAAYYDKEKNLVKKVYYTDYEVFPEITLPLTVTEFNYLPGNDSIVSRMRFSNVKINRSAIAPWFDFVIPADARVIE